jgi:hypothetical protein
MAEREHAIEDLKILAALPEQKAERELAIGYMMRTLAAARGAPPRCGSCNRQLFSYCSVCDGGRR